MNKLPPIKYNPFAGTYIKYACAEAIALAKKTNRIVETSFNGVKMRINKRHPLKHVLNQWDERLHASCRRYNESPAAKIAKEKRYLEVVAKQAKIDIAMGNLGDAIDDLDKLMEWLKPVVENADDSGVNFSTDVLLERLESAGYVKGEYVGNPPEWFNTRSRIGRYIIGQVLDCLHKGMPPHPMTSSFIDKYFELPSDKN